MQSRQSTRYAAGLLAWVLAFALFVVGAPTSQAEPDAPDEASPPAVEMAVPSSSDFGFECRVVGFPAAGISLIRIWDGLPPDTVSARDAGIVRIGTERILTYGSDASYRPVDARLGTPMIVDLGDRRRLVIDEWVENQDGGLAGFSYRLTGDPVYLDVQAGTEIFRGRLSDSGFWPPSDLTLGEDSIEMLLCPPEPITETLWFGNAGSVPVSVSLSSDPMTGEDPGPGACDRFTVGIRDEATGAIAFDGPLCDLPETVVTLAGQLEPGEEATAVVEVRPADRVTPIADPAPGGSAATGSVWVGWASDPSPDLEGWQGSRSWSWVFDLLPTGDPGAEDGFVTFTEAEGPFDDYLVVWPALITDPPVVEVADSGLVCPVVGWLPFGDTWGELRGTTRFHLGVDIPARPGSPLVAIEGGIVRKTVSALGGYELTIDTGEGKMYYYAHLSGYAMGVDDGSAVEAGTLVGFVGSTGNAAGPHLHMGLIVDGEHANPFSTAEAACSSPAADEAAAEDPPGTASVQGQVRYDIEHDGAAASQPGISGISVELLSPDLGVVAEAVTGPNGGYRLGPVEPGTYRVRFRAPDGWEFTRLPDGGALGGDVVGVRTSDGRLMGFTARFDIGPDGTLSLDATLAPADGEAGTP